jgi:hypothetical protein
MRFLLALLLTAVLSFLAGMFLPWWSIAIIAFLVALLIPQRLGFAFLSGLLGIFILWAVLSFWISAQNDNILADKVAKLMKVGSSVLLILATALIGGLIGGFAAMAGSSLRPVRKMRRY